MRVLAPKPGLSQQMRTELAASILHLPNRMKFVSVFYLSFPIPLVPATADQDCNSAPNRNEGLEHDLPPGFGGHSNDSYSDDGDDDGWDSDWDYPPPPPYSREDLYPNERDHVDEYEDDPEPRPYDSRGRGIFADDYDRGDEYDDDLEPPPRHSGRRHTFANDYGHGGGYQEDFEPPPRRSRRRDAFASDYVRGRGYGEDPERPPSRRRRRDMWESDHPHYHVYHDDPGPSLRRNRRRYTYATEYDQDDRYDEYGEPARYRDSTRRAGYDRAELSQHRSRRSVQDSSMDWMYEGSEEGSTPARIYSGSNSRHGRDRNRDDPRRSRVNHPSSRSHLRARPERRKICSLLRSFLNYTTS